MCDVGTGLRKIMKQFIQDSPFDSSVTRDGNALLTHLLSYLLTYLLSCLRT